MSWSPTEAFAGYDRQHDPTRPNIADLFARALELYQDARFSEAESVLLEVHQAQPKHFDALHLLGLIARRTDRLERAVEFLNLAIAQNDAVAPAHRHLANALMDLGRPEEALRSYDRAIVLRPEFAPAQFGHGLALLRLDRAQEALVSFNRAIELGWVNALVHVNRAVALQSLGRSAEAVCSCDEALLLQPDSPEIKAIRGAALIDLMRPLEALESFEQVIAVRPEGASAYNGRGTALHDLQQPEAALDSLDRAIELQPDFADAYINRGVVLAELQRTDAALGSLERAMALRPEDPRAYLNAAHTYLQIGRFDRGWPLYEWRLKMPAAAGGVMVALSARWTGHEELADRKLLIRAEQGLGDTVQFCPYARLPLQCGAQVTLSVQPELVRLIRGLDPRIQVTADGHAPGPFDLHCPLLSLPLVCASAAIPMPQPAPYLTAEPERVVHWRHRLGSQGFRIGVCWQGGRSRIDLGRSYPVAALERIATIPGVRVISLQKGYGSEQLHSLPAGMEVETLGDGFDAGPDAFLDTAAVMECLDLVITSDTSIAHLAGALGRPAWVALKYTPDWRWGLGRADSPWYPSLRLFRQTQRGDWRSVFDAMHTQLVRGRIVDPHVA